MLRIDITRSAGKFIKKLPPKPFKQIVGTILGLRENPKPHDPKQLNLNKINVAVLLNHLIFYRSDVFNGAFDNVPWL